MNSSKWTDQLPTGNMHCVKHETFHFIQEKYVAWNSPEWTVPLAANNIQLVKLATLDWSTYCKQRTGSGTRQYGLFRFQQARYTEWNSSQWTPPLPNLFNPQSATMVDRSTAIGLIVGLTKPRATPRRWPCELRKICRGHPLTVHFL